jgi:RNA polymerase sigma-70 factor (sigma-E family)
VTVIVEPQSFVTFVDQHRSSLLKFAMVLTGDFRRSEDTVADVLDHAFERWERIAVVESPLAYVRKMITNHYLSSQRRQLLWLRRRHQLVDVDRSPDPSADIDGREAMIARLAQLPPRQRSVIAMRYYLDLADTEIADQLGCSPATVRSHAARALATLRVDLSSERQPANDSDETGHR